MVGIYKIENTLNGKLYIGQSWDIRKRWNSHKKWSTNPFLSRSFNKYGIENFKFDVIKEVYKSKFKHFTQKILDEYEKFYIKRYNTTDRNLGYNISSGGERNPNFNGKAMLGKHHSEESRKKISDSSKGQKSYWFGKHLSQESIQKRTKLQAKRILCIETNEIFDSIISIKRKYGFDPSNIIRACRDNQRIYKGFHWQYLSKNKE